MLAAAVVPGGGGDGINIPTLFQRVEYIQSDGNQYVNTGVNTSPDFSAELDLLFTQTPASQTLAMSASGSNGHFWGQYNGVFSFFSSYPTQSPSNVRSIVEYYIDGGYAYIKIGNDSVGFPYSDSTQEWSLFASNSWAGAGSVRLWGGKFYESGVLVRHFIPCYRKSDHKPGLWDVVGWKFYENANTSAQTDFTVGPDVIQPATQYIIFVDRAVEAICATNWGDGVGITPAQAAAVTSLSNKFQNQTSITSFDEFKYFTGVAVLYDSTFGGCSNLSSLSLPDSISSIPGYAFYGIPLTYLDMGAGLTEISGNNIFSFYSTVTVIMRGSTPPTFSYACFSIDTITMYVPYSADHSILSAYQTATASLQVNSLTLLELNPDGTIPNS